MVPAHSDWPTAGGGGALSRRCCYYCAALSSSLAADTSANSPSGLGLSQVNDLPKCGNRSVSCLGA